MFTYQMPIFDLNVLIEKGFLFIVFAQIDYCAVMTIITVFKKSLFE